MRLLVCGGRRFGMGTAASAEREWARKLLDQVHARIPVSLLIQGGASGADSLAALWAVDRGIPFLTVPANWGEQGDYAGPLRNQKMADGRYGETLIIPDAVVALPGGDGTGDMVWKARTKGIGWVWVVSRYDSLACR